MFKYVIIFDMSFKKRFLILFIGFLLALFSFELFLRLDLFNPSEKTEKKIDVSDKKVILAAGDSFVYGAGMNEGEDYPAILDELVQEKGYHVINTGFLGPNTTLVLNRLKDDIKKYKPSIVLVQAGYTNFTNFTGILDKDQVGPGYFLQNLRIVRFFRSLLNFNEKRGKNYVEKEDWHIKNEKAFRYLDNLPVKDFSIQVAQNPGEDIECTIPAYLPDHYSFTSNRFYSSIDYTRKKQDNPGWDYLVDMNYEKAFNFFEKRLSSKEDYKGLVMSLVKLNRYEDALKYVEKAIKHYSFDKEIEVLWLYARVYNCKKKFSQNFLIKKIDDRLKRLSGDVSILLVVGDFYNRIGNDLLASLWYKKALELNSMSSEPYNRLISYYLDKGDLKEAQRYISMGKMNNPYNHELKLFQKGLNILKEKDSEAVFHLLVLEEDFPYAFVRKFIVDTLITTHKYHDIDIKERIHDMLEHDMEFSQKELLITEAFLYQEIDKEELALDVYEKLFKLTDKVLYLKLKADIYYNSGDIDKSIEEFERIEKNIPEEKDYLVSSTLAFLYRKIQEHRGLIHCYEKIHQRFPDDTNTWFALLDALMTAGEYEKAEEKVEQFLKKGDNIDDFVKRSLLEKKIDISVHLAKYRQAIESLKKLIPFLDPKEKRGAYYDIASYYKVLNDYQNATAYYKKINDRIALREMRFYLEKGDNIIYKWLEDDYNKIYELCQKNNSKLVFVNYFESPMPVMKKVAEDKDIIFVDIYSYLKENINRKDEYKSLFQTDGHLTGKGNELTANIIYKTIEDEL